MLHAAPVTCSSRATGDRTDRACRAAGLRGHRQGSDLPAAACAGLARAPKAASLARPRPGLRPPRPLRPGSWPPRPQSSPPAPAPPGTEAAPRALLGPGPVPAPRCGARVTPWPAVAGPVTSCFSGVPSHGRRARCLCVAARRDAGTRGRQEWSPRPHRAPLLRAPDPSWGHDPPSPPPTLSAASSVLRLPPFCLGPSCLAPARVRTPLMTLGNPV